MKLVKCIVTFCFFSFVSMCVTGLAVADSSSFGPVSDQCVCHCKGPVTDYIPTSTVDIKFCHLGNRAECDFWHTYSDVTDKFSCTAKNGTRCKGWRQIDDTPRVLEGKLSECEITAVSEGTDDVSAIDSDYGDDLVLDALEEMLVPSDRLEMR